MLISNLKSMWNKKTTKIYDNICLGTVGTPLPGVEVRITKPHADGSGTEVLLEGSSKGVQSLVGSSKEVSGNLEVRGNGVFSRYWNRPEETKKEFTSDGWFKTGDKLEP